MVAEEESLPFLHQISGSGGGGVVQQVLDSVVLNSMVPTILVGHSRMRTAGQASTQTERRIARRHMHTTHST